MLGRGETLFFYTDGITEAENAAGEFFEDAGLESAIERVAGGRGYSVAAHDVVLRGACEDCRHGHA